ncbi:PAS domain S-box protein [Tumidithrix elongata RA019]|uniref:Circadian input-output histidine kinase CikA n=1 Tax=Tumidithrix elongata BACA0141 TaxID=2716417 RepID=A0AAW9Q0M8_9CYAN|nr:PAS domain S-box protein [Tumidithrix elongata RA019]
MDGQLTYVNSAFARMLGRSVKECLELTYWDITPIKYADREAEQLQIIQTEGRYGPYEKEYIHKDGHLVPALLTGIVILRNDELSIWSSVQDISDRKQAEAKLQNLSYRLELALQSAQIGIWEWDIVGDRLIWDKRMCELYGVSPSEFSRTYQAWAEIVHPDDLIVSNKALQQALAGEKNYETEFRVIWKDSSIRYIRANALVQRDPQGQAQRMIGINYDISDRKFAEEAINRQLAAIEAAINGIAILQGDTYLYANQAHISMFGYDRAEDLIGKPWTLLYSAEELARFETEVFPSLGRDLSWQGEAIATRKDGSTFTEGLSLSLTEDGLLICVCQDISDRKQAEAELQRTNEELARATRLKDEFLANMSHELRTPLNAILGMTEGLQEGVFGDVNERQIKALNTIESSGSHLLSLINDILDVAKIESGQIELDCTPTSVSLLCQSSLVFIKQQAMQKRIKLVTKIPPNLPDLLVDERRVRQVLINLLNNALKFTPGGGCITLEVTHKQQQNLPLSEGEELEERSFLRVAVLDTGIGISPENIKKLFQPFIQIDSALNRQYQGTGLGLALVKRIVELHGGQVGLTSEVGVGSCFSIEMPCAASAASLPESSPQSGDSGVEPSLPKLETSPLILLAEDNPANISTVSAYLEAKGYRMLLATNGLEAVELAKTHHPDLILMDIQIPEMDGIEAMQQIRLDPSLTNLPIVALTALAMANDRQKCLEAGANEYLTKPVRLKELVTAIQHLLDNAI